jgi:ribonuclease R
MNSDAEIIDEWFGRTVIHSDRRFAYEEAQEVIESGSGECAEEILTLHTLAQRLRSDRFKHGAIAFAREEVRFKLDAKGRPIGVYTKIQKEANMLIEEFMLLANRRVAEYCAYRLSNGRRVARPMVFRVHDEPSEDKLERFREFALRFGHYFKAQKGRAIAKEMNKLLGTISGRPEHNAITTLAVRSMAKAVYTTDNIGHYGLAFPYYTHFTSPIRRYPDMMVHRLLSRYLEGGRSASKSKYEELCDHSSSMEQLAASAERASIKYKQVEYMADRMGIAYDAIISGVTEWGLYAEIIDNKCEGLIPMRDLDDDYYEFDERNYCLVGRRTHKRYALGDTVKVQVARCNLEKKQLDYALVE